MRQQTKYIEVAEALLSQIRGMKPGSRCPGVNQVSQEFHIARATAERVLRHLVDRGYVKKVIGKGTFVAQRQGRKVVILSGVVGTPAGKPDESPEVVYQNLADLVARKLHGRGYLIHGPRGQTARGPDTDEVLECGPELLVTVGITDDRYLEELARHGRPIVCIDAMPLALRVDFVFGAAMRSAYLAARALLEAGLTDVWYIGALRGMPNAAILSLTHSAGFCAACQDTGMPNAAARTRMMDSANDLDALLLEILSHRRRPQGVITVNHQVGEYVLAAARRLGTRVPEGLAVIAAWGEEPAAVSCLARDPERMTSAVAEVVWHRFQEPDRPPQGVLVAPQFVDAGTIPPAAARFVRRVLPARGGTMTRRRKIGGRPEVT